MSGSISFLKKPAFQSEINGFVLHEDPIPMDVKRELWALLPKSMEWEAKAHFLYRAGQNAQSTFDRGVEPPPAKVIAELEKLQLNAREMLYQLAGLSALSQLSVTAISSQSLGGVQSSSDSNEAMLNEEQAINGVPSFYFSRISQWWDVVQEIELVAFKAKDLHKADKSHRPTFVQHRNFVGGLVGSYVFVVGKFPPKSKSSWFPKFVALLGEHFEAKVGTALIESRLEEIKKFFTKDRFSSQFGPNPLPQRAYWTFEPPVKRPD